MRPGDPLWTTTSTYPPFFFAPRLAGLVEKGELPVRKVGNQRRLPLADVLEYKARTRANRLEALRELTALDQELGLR